MSIIPDAGPDTEGNIKARLYTTERCKDFELRLRGNRHFITVKGEQERNRSLCNKCGGEGVARGYCCGCGSPA